MEIMKYIASSMNHKKINMYLYLLAPFVLLLVYIFNNDLNTYISTYSQTNIYVHILLYYLPPTVMMIVTYIWFYFSKVFCDNIASLGRIFEDDNNYQKLYKTFIWWLRLSSIGKDTTSSIIKILYHVLWFTIWISYICSLKRLNFIPTGTAGYMFIFLMLILIFLNFSSYYSCFAVIFFIKNVSNIDKLRYNSYYPSHTVGYQELKNISKTTYSFFLLDSLFCLFIQFIILYRYKVYGFDESNEEKFKLLLFLTIVALILGLLSFCIIAFCLNRYSRKLYDKWSKKSLSSFQEELYKAEKNNIGVDEVLTKMDRLCKDKELNSKPNKISLILTISTIIFNIIQIIEVIIIYP